MKVLVRADATLDIGSGHVMRCAALAMRLKTRGAQIHFVCIDLNERLADWLCRQGFGLSILQDSDITDWHTDLDATRSVARDLDNIDLLIVDHYRLDVRWEHGMRTEVRHILVIDDLADRNHDCDYLLDQNLHDNAQSRYAQRIPDHAIQFLGPQYALLRTEFDKPGLERERVGEIENLFVFFGGTDPGKQTIKVLDALRKLGANAPHSVVVLGHAYPYRDEVQRLASDLPHIRVLDDTDQMSVLMSQADLAIGTCGVAAWERCALGLPCLVVVSAENQREDANILHRLGAVELLGDAEAVDTGQWELILRQMLDDPQRVEHMAIAARKVMCGRHAALAELETSLIKGTLSNAMH